MERKLYEVLGEALKYYPDIKIGCIGIEYRPKVFFAQLERDVFSLYLPDTSCAMIGVDDLFIDSDRDLQIAILIHEIAHYSKRRGNEFRADKGMKYLEKGRLKRIISTLTKQQREEIRLGMEAYIENELYADAKVIKAGYGHTLLDQVKKVHVAITDKVFKETLEKRIANLEEKLGIKNE